MNHCEEGLHKSCTDTGCFQLRFQFFSTVSSSFLLDEPREQQPAFKDRPQRGKLCHKAVGGDPMLSLVVPKATVEL